MALDQHTMGGRFGRAFVGGRKLVVGWVGWSRRYESACVGVWV